MIVYTDGSCKPDRTGGWAFLSVLREDKTYFRLGKVENSTCNRTELFAVLQAIKYIGKREAFIYTDSRYCSNGINKEIENWAKSEWKTKAGRDLINCDLWKQIKELLDKNSSIRVFWASFKNKKSPHYPFHKYVDSLSKRAVRLKKK